MFKCVCVGRDTTDLYFTNRLRISDTSGNKQFDSERFEKLIK